MNGDMVVLTEFSKKELPLFKEAVSTLHDQGIPARICSRSESSADSFFELYVPKTYAAQAAEQIQSLVPDSMLTSESSSSYQDPSLVSDLLKRSSNIYVSSFDKYTDLNSSGSSLLITGCFLLILLTIDLSRIIKLPVSGSSRVLTDTVIGIMAAGCLLGSHYTFKKANLARTHIIYENRARQQIINWFLSTYTASYIDNMISAADPSALHSMETHSLKRLDMIMAYLSREYSHEDESYLEDLCEELYQILFESNDLQASQKRSFL